MLTEKLHTNYRKTLVEQHFNDFDETIFASLYDNAQRSTKAFIESSDLLEYITSSRFGNNTWEESSESFILH